MEDSNGTNSTFSSLAEAPERLERQYAPLREVFQAHPSQLPHTTPDPQSNSEGMASRGLVIELTLYIQPLYLHVHNIQ